MAGAIKTYNPKQVNVILGTHIVTGYAEDTFVTVDPNSDGVSKRVGCDGEVVRSISPDDTYVIKLALLYGSPTNTFLQNRLDQDLKTGDGMFSLSIVDNKGGTMFHALNAWPVRAASRGYGREAPGCEWEIHTGSGVVTENR